MKRVALFFGSFNPIHNGHLHMAQEVLKQNKADEVQFVLSPQNPFKERKTLLPEHHRWAMLQLALEPFPLLIPNDVELHLPKPSYTATTLKTLQKQNPDNNYSLLVGADTAKSLPTWHMAEYLLKFPLWIYPRKGVSLAEFPAEQQLSDVSMQDISATDIRAASDLKRIKKWLPCSVYAYLETHLLLTDI